MKIRLLATFLFLSTVGCGAAPGYEAYFSEPSPQSATRSFRVQLEPYGEWIAHAELGEVFCPAEPNYQPYYAGTWVEKNGAYEWVSDEPIAWAVYHYGRWAHLGGAEVQIEVRTEQGQRISPWCWQPGDDWAASWVEFRVDERFDTIGWAPLPPAGWDIVARDFRYVDVEDFFSNDLPGCYYDAPAVRRVSRRTVRVHTRRLRREHERRRRVRVASRRRATPDRVALNRVPRRVPTPPVSAPLRPSRPSVSVDQTIARPNLVLRGQRRPARVRPPVARPQPRVRPPVVQRARPTPPVQRPPVARPAAPRARPSAPVVPQRARVRTRSHLDHPMTGRTAIPARRVRSPSTTPRAHAPSSPMFTPPAVSNRSSRSSRGRSSSSSRSSRAERSSSSSSMSRSRRESPAVRVNVPSATRSVRPSSSSRSSSRRSVRVR